MHERRVRLNMIGVISMFLIFTIAGCAMFGSQKAADMEKLLEAAGFHMRVADTESKLAQLGELPQRKLVAQHWGGKLRYVYVDAKNCKCAYVGDEKAYKQFQYLALQKQMAEEDRIAAERAKPATMDWGGWRFDESW